VTALPGAEHPLWQQLAGDGADVPLVLGDGRDEELLADWQLTAYPGDEADELPTLSVLVFREGVLVGGGGGSISPHPPIPMPSASATSIGCVALCCTTDWTATRAFMTYEDEETKEMQMVKLPAITTIAFVGLAARPVTRVVVLHESPVMPHGQWVEFPDRLRNFPWERS
jgi:hypothetical protein